MLLTKRRGGVLQPSGGRRKAKGRGSFPRPGVFTAVVRLGATGPRVIPLLLICDSYIIMIRIRQFCISQRLGCVTSTCVGLRLNFSGLGAKEGSCMH